MKGGSLGFLTKVVVQQMLCYQKGERERVTARLFLLTARVFGRKSRKLEGEN